MNLAPNRPTLCAKPSLLTTAAAVAGKTLRSTSRTPQVIGATLGQGVLFLLVFRYVFGGAIDVGSLAYVDYMVPGIFTAASVFAAAGAAVGVAEDRSTGFADRVLSLPTSRLGIVAGRATADTVIVLAATAVTLVAAFAVGFEPAGSWSKLAAAAGLIVFYAAAFSAAFGALGMRSSGPQAAQGLGFLAIPLTFVSSAYVPTETMPDWLAAVARNQPITHMVDALRGLLHPGAVADHWASVVLATGSGLVIAAAALTLARWSLER